ncbi:MAG TPA: carboxypeptidase regulatory-like domain-containing protein [Bryobacteraceae bacterium]|nr:carboxypeptidase regulatory-like domain-containing protein [Bryobacteraceae bacterium]
MKPLILLVLAANLGAQTVKIDLPQPQATFPTGNSSIEGAVINEVTQAPVRQAQVTISANAPPAVTDSTGRFAFRNLAPGTYWLQADHPLFSRSARAAARPLNITLGQDEQKRDVVIPLTPGATITGTVLDEDKKPMEGCNVQAFRFQPGQTGRELNGAQSASTDTRGQYRIYGLPGGRYYLMAQCHKTLLAPHPLMRIGPDTDLPQMRYSVEFLPGTPDSTASGRLTVAAGADLQSVDFQMHATATVTVHGRLSGDSEALQHNPWVQLVPRDHVLNNVIQYTGRVDTRRSTFRIDAVPPGSYTLLAIANSNEHGYQAQIPVDIGAEPPEPIVMTFLPGASFTGSIEVAGDQPQPIPSAMIRFIPLNWPVYSQPYAKIENGKFTISGVMPGRWRLEVDNVQGYVKSFTIGDQPVSPYGFNVGPASGGAMRIVMGDHTAQIEGTVTGERPEGASLWLMVVPEDPDRIAASRFWTTGLDGSGHFMLNGVEPGKYRLFALAGVEPWTIQQNFSLLKAIADRGVQLELDEGAKATAQVEITPSEEITRVIQEQE